MGEPAYYARRTKSVGGGSVRRVVRQGL